jgi:hypothetical protein
MFNLRLITEIFDNDIPRQAFADGDPGIADPADKPAAVGNLLNDRGFTEPQFPQTLANAFFPAQTFNAHALAGPDVVKRLFPGAAPAFLRSEQSLPQCFDHNLLFPAAGTMSFTFAAQRLYPLPDQITGA